MYEYNRSQNAEDVFYLPSPCIICVGFKYACYTILLVVILGYVGKAMFIAHERNETYYESIWHWEFWTWDTIFFFYAFGFLVVAYSLVVITVIVMRFLFKCNMIDNARKKSKPKNIAETYI